MAILDFIFPKSCLGCRKGNSYICPDCIAHVRLAKPVCIYCEKASIDGLTHVKCSKKFGLDGLTSVWEYEGVIRNAILALKYKYSLEAGRELCGVFAEYIKDSSFLLHKEALVPVPIFWYRQNSRGFNQSELIGKTLAELLNVKFEPELLVRNRSVKPQVELSGEERRHNLKGVFGLNPGKFVPESVLLFDDVATTGSTLMEAAKILKRAGVKKVWGLTIAR